MSCYQPIPAWRSRTPSKSGRPGITFVKAEAYTDQPVLIPCGRCVGCLMDRSRQWAVRCVHEAELYEDNCFITLTYNDDNLPPNGSLDKSHFVNFMKRLRKKYCVDSVDKRQIRFFHCGEYGEKLFRPHHHACLFNHRFPDEELVTVKRGRKIYTSAELQKLWPYGFVTVDAVTYASAAYVAGYCQKKRYGRNSDHLYGEPTGVMITPLGNIPLPSVNKKTPEYVTMSRRPGIGSAWYEKYKGDIYPHCQTSIGGTLTKPPKYYDRRYEIDDPDQYDIIMRKRLDEARKKNPMAVEEARQRYASHKRKSQKSRRYEDELG